MLVLGSMQRFPGVGTGSVNGERRRVPFLCQEEGGRVSRKGVRGAGEKIYRGQLRRDLYAGADQGALQLLPSSVSCALMLCLVLVQMTRKANAKEYLLDATSRLLGSVADVQPRTRPWLRVNPWADGQVRHEWAAPGCSALVAAADSALCCP